MTETALVAIACLRCTPTALVDPAKLDEHNSAQHPADVLRTAARLMREHCASMHPAVALAVADWLEDEAVRIDDVPYRVDSDWIERNYRGPLAVARAYLGGDRG